MSDEHKHEPAVGEAKAEKKKAKPTAEEVMAAVRAAFLANGYEGAEIAGIPDRATVWQEVMGRPAPSLRETLRQVLQTGIDQHTFGRLQALGHDLYGEGFMK